MIDVRFRVIVWHSKWMEDDKICIYLFIKHLEEVLKAELNKEPTETEMTQSTSATISKSCLRTSSSYMSVPHSLSFSTFSKAQKYVFTNSLPASLILSSTLKVENVKMPVGAVFSDLPAKTEISPFKGYQETCTTRDQTKAWNYQEIS